MGGREFEEFVSFLFSKIGYTVILTKTSGDQGIDVIAEKNGVKLGIQTKCYSNNVSNSTIQEVVAGLKFYNCDKAVIITNSHLTKSAIRLADANDVIIWDREILKDKIAEILC